MNVTKSEKIHICFLLLLTTRAVPDSSGVTGSTSDFWAIHDMTQSPNSHLNPLDLSTSWDYPYQKTTEYRRDEWQRVVVAGGEIKRKSWRGMCQIRQHKRKTQVMLRGGTNNRGEAMNRCINQTSFYQPLQASFDPILPLFIHLIPIYSSKAPIYLSQQVSLSPSFCSVILETLPI